MTAVRPSTRTPHRLGCGALALAAPSPDKRTVGAERFSDTAALFEAPGGSWWNRTDVDPKLMGKPDVFWLPPIQDVHLARPGR
jgi:hypothetical protein